MNGWEVCRYPLGRVAHCIAATMASLASNARCAAVLMAEDKHHGAVAALMLLAKVHDRGVFEQSGHVRASAACALSFLACHNMGARGEDCLTGPYRPALLEQGALVWIPSLACDLVGHGVQHCRLVTDEPSARTSVAVSLDHCNGCCALRLV